MSESSTTPILVIDDEAIALKLVTRLLERIGFTAIDTAVNGVEGRRLMEQKLYGLVICDWNMPEMSGLDLLKIVRTTDKWKRLPFLMTSIDGSLERVKIARMAAVSAFLLKPFDETQLRTKLEEVLPTPLPKRKLVFSVPVPPPETRPSIAESA
jgi:two-component system, chemotaxis family, chemotaxis protein CheY